MPTIGTLIISLEANTARLETDLKRAGQHVKDTERLTQDSVNKMNALFGMLGATISVASVIAFGKSVVDAAEEAEQAQLKLQAVYKATGGVVGYTTDELNRMADAISTSTHFDDESIRNGMSEIIKFGSVTGAVFKDSLQVIADYATFSGQAFPEAASAVAKALADPETASKLLKQAGVILTESQKDLIKSLKEAGDEAGAQHVILERLEGTYRGMEKTLNSGLTGATKSLSKEWGDLLEVLGQSTHSSAIADHALGGIASTIQRLRESIAEANEQKDKSFLFNKGKSAPLQLVTPVPGNTDLLAGKTLADLQAINAEIAHTNEVADAAEEARRKKLTEKAALANQKMAEEDDRYWIEKAKKDYARGEQQTFDLMRGFEKRSAALRQMAEEASASDLERAQLKQGSELAELELQRQMMATDHELTLAELETFEQAKADIIAAHSDAISIATLNDDKKIVDGKIRYQKISLDSMGAFFGMAKGLMNSHSRAAFELGKSAAIGETVINTYKSATGAYSAMAAIPVVGPALGVAAAAAAIASGMAQVSAIQSTSFGGGSAGGGSYGGSYGGATSATSDGAATPTYPMEPAPAAPKAGIIVNVNLGDDPGVPGVKWVRDLVELLNEQIRDGVVIEQIRVS